ncbi:MAG: hypothetical protein IT532_15305 [Burkholderiales bacterium]|nr:hypothetical protein [Burkholderiales bacterium]
MNAAHGARLGWIARRALLGLRWPGMAGVVMAAAALVIALGAGRPMLERLQSLEREARTLGARSASTGAEASPRTPHGQLSNFYAFFPPPSALPDLLSRMQRAARDNGLTLPRGEYRLVRDPAFALARYQITYPVQGAYAQVRGFVNDVLDGVPAAALEEMTLERDDVSQGVLEARVRFSLYLGTQP